MSGAVDAPRPLPQLEVEGVACAYGDTPVLEALSFSLRDGEIGCLLGPSGCGKTTALRCIAGLEPVQRGRITLAGTEVSAPGRTLEARRRRVGLVFQDYALFPHLSVAGNVGFGLDGLAAAARRERVREVLALVGLEHQAEVHPAALSGGQQQRVALARALAPRPRLLLLDEPFSNLDLQLRERLCAQVARILRATGTTALLVTHDQQEAFATADTVGVMHEGRLLQWGPPEALYWRPQTRFVAEFIGAGVMLRGLRRGDAVETVLGRATLGRAAAATAGGGEVLRVLVRPEDVAVLPVGGAGGGGGSAAPHGRIVHRQFRGGDVLLQVELTSGETIQALAASREQLAPGDAVALRWQASDLVAFAAED